MNGKDKKKICKLTAALLVAGLLTGGLAYIVFKYVRMLQWRNEEY